MLTPRVGRDRVLVAVLLALALPLVLVVYRQTAAATEGQSVGAAVLSALAALPRADDAEPITLPGEPAGESDKAAIGKAAGDYSSLLREGRFKEAWRLIDPETYGEWEKRTWEETRAEMPRLSEEELEEALSDSPMALMVLGDGHEVVNVRTRGDEGIAHVATTIRTEGVIVLRRRGDEWAIDLLGTDEMSVRKDVQRQLGALATPDRQSFFFGLMFGEAFCVMPDLTLGLPLEVIQHEVTQVTVDGDRAYAAIRSTGRLHTAVPVELVAGRWTVSWGEGAHIMSPDTGLTEFQTSASSPRIRARQAECLRNMKQLSPAMLMYASDYDEKFPPADKWCDATYPYIKDWDLHGCPADTADFSYAMNHKLSRLSLGMVESPWDTILLYESALGVKNACDKHGLPGNSVPDPPRHGDHNNFAYVDGHVKALQPMEVRFDLFRIEKLGDVGPGEPTVPEDESMEDEGSEEPAEEEAESTSD